MPLDPQVQTYLDQLVAQGGRPYHEMVATEARSAYTAVAALRRGPSYTPEPVGSVEDRTFAGVPVRVYTPAEPETRAVVAFFHGGGWVIGDLDTHDPQARALCVRTGASVVSVNYRLSPECPYPAALDDCDAVTRSLVEQGPVAVAGDSAGGNVAAAVALRARDRGGPGLVAQLLIYPAVDASLRLPSVKENGEGYGLDAATMRWYLDQYLPDPALRTDPYASPLAADDLAGLPPAVICTAEYDPLRDEGEAYAQRLRAAGVPVTLLRYEGLIHGFFGMGAAVAAAATAIDQTCAALRDLLTT